MLEGVNSKLKDFGSFKNMGWKFGFLREKERIGQLGKGFREKSNTLIYNGSVTPNLHPLP